MTGQSAPPSPSPFASDALAGKRVLITGGGTGLGRGLAGHLVAHGADVHLWGRRESVLREAAEEASAGKPDRVHVDVVDIRRFDRVDEAMGALWAEHGPLTSVLNNAGANFIARTEDLSPRAFEAVTSTIMDGSYFTTTAAARRWIAGGLPGSVLSNLTTWVWSGSAFVVPAAMAKAAVHAMTMSLAAEWARHRIRVNAIAPGPIPTDYAWAMLNPTDRSSGGATQTDRIPAGRPGTVAELAHLVIFLLSDACDYLTGQTIAMDGGQMLAGPGTFAELATLTDADWTEIRAQSTAASATSAAQRTTQRNSG
ncbi:NAD(P)-dependent dehydrogenase, short-chain alcohol dehydrogenase family [Frankia canadensis]|uniref:NAD(P)-dependent dehydrogenase, short-chain alcohol dehydrogenase family n=1 Tax=Frankia canadensis TaxID=1836972 RepID=A0A2I2KPW3_9ACTN|nr:SDR family oxidoreductase [Frankia canadensis]SNQ47705.1 NAD(P)-dependent dehydrogenase, short-chain alcohol dehydrogenase family [Frankia canadensis]SOU54995.1 NAD(P)-dependent dehydrogenase, short-chain alcohol dehydrogenase family [Frankia canadensis]